MNVTFRERVSEISHVLLTTGLVKGGKITASWLPNGGFWYADDTNPDGPAISSFDPVTGTVAPLFSLAKLSASLGRLLGRELGGGSVTTAQIVMLANDTAQFSFEGETYTYDVHADIVARVPKPNFVETFRGVDPAARSRPGMMQRPGYFPDLQPVPETLSPDGKRFASLKDGNIFIRETSDGRYDQLTFDAEPPNGWDVESTRYGVGSAGGLIFLSVQPWSPDGLRLYATRFDQRTLKPYHRLRYLGCTDEVEQQHFARAGDALPILTPAIFDVLSGSAVPIDLDVTDHFLLLLGWREDGKALHLLRISRDCKTCEVFRVDANTGAVTRLFGETGRTFIRVQHEVVGGRSGCTVLPGSKGFLWESERDGWKHLYHYDAKGQLVRQLTSGEWPVDAVIGFDAASDTVYFGARIDQARPYDLHIARVPLAGGTVEQLTSEPGLHDAQFAPDFGYFIDTVQSAGSPPRSRLKSNDGTLLIEFAEADIGNLREAGWTEPQEFCVKAADGTTDLHGMMYLPPDFDPSRKYPLIEYIYGGPQAAMVERKFFAPMAKMTGLSYILPHLGFIVVQVDARGTPLRSKTFHDEVYGNWRRSVTADHAAAISNLAAERPYIDLDRVGIWGHSWGGYFTTACMIDAPHVYKAGVASAPGYNPYDAFIYEPYIGGVPSPDTKAAYEDALLYTDAAKVEGAMMIVAGTNDISVWHSAMVMSHALVRAGVHHDFVPMVDQHHGYDTASENYFIEKLTGHFQRYLMGADQ